MRNDHNEQDLILIVDDNIGNLELLSEILSRENYNTVKANSAKNALSIIANSLPSLIILDIRMPEMDGFELCRVLKADVKTQDIPIIFITALNDKKFLEAGFLAGGVDHIVIPFDRNEILARVKTHLNLYRIQQNLRDQNNRLEKEIKLNEARFESLIKINGNQLETIQDFLDFTLEEVIRLTESKIGYIYFYDEIKKEFTLNTWSKQVMDECKVLEPERTYQLEKTGIWGEAVRQRKPIMLNDFPTANPLKKGTPEGHVHMSKFLTIPVFSNDRIVAVVGVANKEADYTDVDIRQLTLMMDAVWKTVQRKYDEDAIAESENRFRTTLISVGDGVITTDTSSRVTFLNPVAENLTGWSLAEANGKTLEEIFPIVNEDTREQVEIPVRKVLREGIIVGLANHTILIAKDGTERPIADSGAPVRNEKGEITGVVLVFRDQTKERNDEKALKESEKRFKLLYENAPLSYQSLDSNARIIDVNPTWLKTLGYSHDEVIGRSFGDFMTPESAILIKDRFADFVAKGEIHDYQFEMVRKDGTLFLVSYDGRIGYNEFGHFKQTHCIFTDITDREKAAKALKESEEEYNSLIQNLHVGIVVHAPDTSIILANEQASIILGLSLDQLKGKTVIDPAWHFMHEDQSIMPIEEYPVNKVISTKKPLENMVLGINRPATCDRAWVLVHAFPEFDASGELIKIVVSFVDISARKQVEANLRESEGRYNTFINADTDLVFVKDDQFRYLMANNAMASFFGKTKDELIGKTDQELADQTKVFPCQSSDKKAIASDSVITVEEKLGDRVYETSKFPLNLSGNKRGIGGIMRDITERKNADEAIQNERHLLRTLIDNLPDPIYVKNSNAQKLIANRADLENMGFQNEDLVIGKTDQELFENVIGERGYEDDLKVLQTGVPILNKEELFVNKEGFKRWLLTSKIPLLDYHGVISGLVGIGRDITEQKKANETILKLSESIEQSPSSLVITDTHGNIEYVNPKFTETTGYSSEEAIGQNPRILKSDETPSEDYKDLWDTISTGGVWRGEFHNRRKNGELYWEWATITSIKNEKGEIINYIATKEDISLRKQMEADLIVAKEKAEESDRLKSSFLANMSHEIRTPLNSIIGFSELLNDQDFDESQKSEFIQHITTNGNNLLNIISDIMDISKIESGEITIRKKKINVRSLLETIRSANLMRINSKQIELKCVYPDLKNDVFVFADQDRLMQIFNNLIGNALKFTSKGYIEVGYEMEDAMVKFKVKDTGIGISPEFHQRIFERFRQVESADNRNFGGNGLGLTITKNLVELMDGKIWIESEPGKGSTFYFALPKSY